jgi:acylphosphatase
VSERIAHCLVRGRVQGVGFRWFVRERAAELGLRGWCANLSDGRVEVWAEGDPARVGELVDALRRGPPSSRVEDVLVETVSGEDSAAAPLAADRKRVAFAGGS